MDAFEKFSFSGYVNVDYTEFDSNTYSGCELRIRDHDRLTPKVDFKITFDTGDFDYDIFWINKIGFFLGCFVITHMSSVDNFYADRG